MLHGRNESHTHITARPSSPSALQTGTLPRQNRSAMNAARWPTLQSPVFLNCSDSNCRGQCSVAYPHPCTSVLVNPPNGPRPLSLLHLHQSLVVDSVQKADPGRGHDTHPKRQRVSREADPFSNACGVDRKEPSADVGGGRNGEEAGEAEEEGIAAFVVVGPVFIRAGAEGVEDPVEGIVELVSSSVLVEECEYVGAHYWIYMSTQCKRARWGCSLMEEGL